MRASPSGISILNKKTGVGTSLLYDVEPGATIACLGPLGGRSKPFRRRAKRGWLPAASGWRRS